MGNAEIDRPLQFSVLDRLLIGEDDHLEAGESDIGRLRAFVLRDLRWLLNSRRSPPRLPEPYRELQHSVLAYGFMDISSLAKDSPVTRSRLVSQIEESLSLFEPRLTSVRVTIPQAVAGSRHELRIVIRGVLRADPIPIQFAFDTVIDRLRGEVSVSEVAGDGGP